MGGGETTTNINSERPQQTSTAPTDALMGCSPHFQIISILFRITTHPIETSSNHLSPCSNASVVYNQLWKEMKQMKDVNFGLMNQLQIVKLPYKLKLY